jgi:hypothetical protein
MKRTDYTYKLLDGLLSIVDLNLGRVSVTNCIEDVVEEICEKENADPLNMYIVYKDTEGIWDGWDHRTKRFIPLGSKDNISAIFKLIAEKMKKDIE